MRNFRERVWTILNICPSIYLNRWREPTLSHLILISFFHFSVNFQFSVYFAIESNLQRKTSIPCITHDMTFPYVFMSCACTLPKWLFFLGTVCLLSLEVLTDNHRLLDLRFRVFTRNLCQLQLLLAAIDPVIVILHSMWINHLRKNNWVEKWPVTRKFC